MKIKYVGEYRTVTVEVDKTVLEVDRGEAFEVPDDEGKRLIQQDIWEQVGAPKSAKPRKARAKKAPAKAVEPEQVTEDIPSDEASADADQNKEG